MIKIKLQIVEGNCEYICKNRVCKRNAVFSLDNKKYCCQHLRIMLENLLQDRNIHEFYEKQGQKK